jgi:hypothetical protein
MTCQAAKGSHQLLRNMALKRVEQCAEESTCAHKLYEIHP